MNIFDIIGPVMIGPSSSHTAGAARLGKVARTIFARKPSHAYIGLYGSFAKTGKGHGTDKALVAGILGMGPEDTRIRESFSYAKEEGLDFTIEEISLDGAHPNTAVLILSDREGNSFRMKGASVGGGSIEVKEMDGYQVDLNFETPTLVVIHQDHPGVIAAVTEELYKGEINICRFTLSRKKKGGEALMSIGLDSMPDPSCVENIEKIDFVTRAKLLDKI